MWDFRSAVLLSMLVASTSLAYAAEFPTAPPKLKDAEAQGLVRVSAAELKESLPGKWEEMGTKGKRLKTLNPDGTAHRTGFSQKEGDGKWRIDEKNNAFCNAFYEKKGYTENCFAVFRAPDGIHFFDYEIDTGFYQRVRRRAAEE